ncbi:MAG TPA: magnesium transporter [Anaerolineae bacterium]|nr:magnesium transporter [Anaerolineae bacterium]
MDTLNLDEALARLRAALERDDLADARRVIEALQPEDQADVVSELDDEDQVTLLPNLDPADSADILEKMENQDAADLADALPHEALIRIVDEMESDEAADLLGDIAPAQAEAVLSAMEDPEDVRPLLMHTDDSAGGLMTSEFLALRRRMTAREAIEAIRLWQPDAEEVYYLFVVDREGVLVGVVSLRALVVADPTKRLEEIMDTAVISVRVGADQEECARLISRYDLLALPVVDADGRLLGVVTVDDVVDVLVDEATEDIQRLGGAQPLDRPYLDTSPFSVFGKRAGWLLLLFVTGSLTGSVLRHFEAQLEAVVALAFFVPLLIGTGGNAGTQTTSTIIRALGVGEVELKDALRALRHELVIGLLLGAAMAVVAYLRALTWGSGQDLALAVAVAIFVIVMWANGLGSLLPLLASRLKIDPAVVSGPVMSTLVDATGLFIYLTIATLFLGL